MTTGSASEPRGPASGVTTPTSRVVLLSIAASVVTMALKITAWGFTGSVSLLSDALESTVNLAAALIAFIALTVADRPADRSHAYGHDKAEYFSSGVEGGLILVAAIAIIYTAVQRFLHPMPLTDLGAGIGVALAASGINFGVSRFMLRKARRYDSIALEADARHLMTDVWTSAGVVAALAVVAFAPPRWMILDPIVAVLVGLNIIRTGAHLIRRSMAGLMDGSLPETEIRQVEEAIRASLDSGAAYHSLRTRKSGSRRFVELHVTVPGDLCVTRGHDCCERIEAAIERRLPKTSVSTHLEPDDARPDRDSS
ncbi:MAG: cation transporter [Acidobacteria bacterium]|nr:cation transporter [Acidobacteriota bacterium]